MESERRAFTFNTIWAQINNEYIALKYLLESEGLVFTLNLFVLTFSLSYIVLLFALSEVQDENAHCNVLP